MIDSLNTSRLLLRRFRETDRDAFAAMNADPVVMQHMPAVLDRAESDALVDRIEQHFEQHGFGLWAVEVTDQARFIGFVGLMNTPFAAHFTPCVEVAWRLAADCWGQGYAIEAARAVCKTGFETIGLHEIVSFTVQDNFRSRRVMERLGMSHSAHDDFDHPRLPEGHPLRRHVLYRLTGPNPTPLTRVA